MNDYREKIIVASISSDSHTWNLVYMHLLMEELGYEVINLGACTDIQEIIKNCLYYQPRMLLISTINGHGYIEGAQIIQQIKGCDLLSNLNIVIGGKLGISADNTLKYKNKLLEAGFSSVFDGENAVNEFLDKLLLFPQQEVINAF